LWISKGIVFPSATGPYLPAECVDNDDGSSISKTIIDQFCFLMKLSFANILKPTRVGFKIASILKVFHEMS